MTPEPDPEPPIEYALVISVTNEMSDSRYFSMAFRDSSKSVIGDRVGNQDWIAAGGTSVFRFTADDIPANTAYITINQSTDRSGSSWGSTIMWSSYTTGEIPYSSSVSSISGTYRGNTNSNTVVIS